MLFSLSKPKVVYSRPFLSSLPFPKLCMYFGYKHVGTGPNCSHELATFLMPSGACDTQEIC